MNRIESIRECREMWVWIEETVQGMVPTEHRSLENLKSTYCEENDKDWRYRCALCSYVESHWDIKGHYAKFGKLECGECPLLGLWGKNDEGELSLICVTGHNSPYETVDKAMSSREYTLALHNIGLIIDECDRLLLEEEK